MFRKYFWIPAFLVLLASHQIPALAQKKSRTLPRDGVIARVNDDIILASEVWKRLAPLLQYKKKRLSESEFKEKKRTWFRNTISSMIRSRVIQQEAEKAGLSVSDQEIKEAVKDQIKKIGSREKFINGLKQRGWTLEKWKREKRKDLLQQKLFRKKFKESRTTFFVSPKELRRYYENHKSQFYREPKVKGLLISIPFGEKRKKREARSIAKSILQQIEDGARMKHLVQAYKNLDPERTRTFDWIKKGTFSQKVERWLFEKLDGEEVAGPITLENSVVLVKRTGKIKEKKSAFQDPEVQEKIRQRIRNQKYREQLKEIEKELLKEAYIKPRYFLNIG